MALLHVVHSPSCILVLTVKDPKLRICSVWRNLIQVAGSRSIVSVLPTLPKYQISSGLCTLHLTVSCLLLTAYSTWSHIRYIAHGIIDRHSTPIDLQGFHRIFAGSRHSIPLPIHTKWYDKPLFSPIDGGQIAPRVFADWKCTFTSVLFLSRFVALTSYYIYIYGIFGA